MGNLRREKVKLIWVFWGFCKDDEERESWNQLKKMSKGGEVSQVGFDVVASALE